MLSRLYPLLRPALGLLDPETAHHLAISALKRLPPAPPPAADPALAVSAFGLSFPNPLGLAAGFDKNAEVAGQMRGLGFGHVEIGTVTPLPQEGNPRPRLFRLDEDRAVINRMGFNGAGATAVAARLSPRAPGILGVNIGANKDAADRIADYVVGVRQFGPCADYLAINISSPNTPGLRGLQASGDFAELLERVMAARADAERRPPLLVKIAPDLDDAALEAIAELALAHGVDGLIVSNTTLGRDSLRSRHAGEAGGLSGAPLFARATRILAKVHLLTAGRLPLIGVGGVRDAETAIVKIEAGASLVQLYTGLVFEGPGLPRRILAGLQELLRRRGVSQIAELTGSRATALAHQTGSGA